MFEKMYIRLLRLYPSRFRKEYGDEALQLIRDRLRDETGFLKRACLCWDLVADAFVSLPKEYRNSYALREAAPLPLSWFWRTNRWGVDRYSLVAFFLQPQFLPLHCFSAGQGISCLSRTPMDGYLRLRPWWSDSIDRRPQMPARTGLMVRPSPHRQRAKYSLDPYQPQCRTHPYLMYRHCYL
jgi:hypothetical protein